MDTLQEPSEASRELEGPSGFARAFLAGAISHNVNSAVEEGLHDQQCDGWMKPLRVALIQKT